MDKIINTALIGFGLAGSVFHGPTISVVEGLNLTKIYTTKEEAVKKAQREYPEAEVVQNLDSIFDDEEIQLIVVATPNTYHYDLAKRAILKGKHVVVDKPFTITSKEADELIALAKEHKRMLTVYQNRRLDSDFKTVKKVIESGMLGNLVEYEAHFHYFRNYLKQNAWREENIPGSGILYDLAAHLIDQAQCLFGLPEEIYADVRAQRKGAKIDDNFQLILYYEGLRVVLKAGMLVKEPLPHFILLGDKGSFVKYGRDVQEGLLKTSKDAVLSQNFGKEPEDLWGTLDVQVNGINFRGKVESEAGDYREFYRDVYRAITEGVNPSVMPEQARNTIRIIELAMESNKKRCSVKFSN